MIDPDTIVIKNAAMYHSESTAISMNLSGRMANQKGYESALFLISIAQAPQW